MVASPPPERLRLGSTRAARATSSTACSA